MKIQAFGITRDFDFNLGLMTEAQSGLRFEFDTHGDVHTPRGVLPAPALPERRGPWVEPTTHVSWEFSVGCPEQMFLYSTGLAGFNARAYGHTTEQGWRWEDGCAVRAAA